MDIRIAIQDDLTNIAGVYVKNHKTTYQNLLDQEYLDSLTLSNAQTKWASYLSDTDKKIWVAYEEHCFLGFVAGKKDPELEHTWYLDSLHVTENARGKGVGTALIQTIGRYAIENHYYQMSVCIVKGNDQAGRLYQKLGAQHFKDFMDKFGNTDVCAEKLLWEGLGLENRHNFFMNI